MSWDEYPQAADAPEAHRVPAEGTEDEVAGSRLPDPARRAFVTLLTNRYIARSRHRHVWDALLNYEAEIRVLLSQIFLDLVIDREVEVAFKRQQEGEDIPRVLRRDKPLSRDASLVLIYIRRECAYADLSDQSVVVTRDQIGEFLRTFQAADNGDAARFERRVDAAINSLVKPLGLLIPDPEVDYLFTVSPVVVPLVGTDEIQRLEAAFRSTADGTAGQGTDDDQASANDGELTGDEA
jgi:Domain of unknown function (DUF4194)